MREERPARVRVDIEVRAWPTADRPAVVRDISVSGCLLVTTARLKQAQQVPLAIPAEGGGELRLTGTVVRWHEGAVEGGGGYGIRFDPVPEEERRALELLVASGGERPPAAA
jgi:hypothetical protein